jgi:hypothetical protein
MHSQGVMHFMLETLLPAVDTPEEAHSSRCLLCRIQVESVWHSFALLRA